MLSKKFLWPVILFGSTYLLAMDDRFRLELFLFATETPTEIIEIILPICNKLKRYKFCEINNLNSPDFCFLPYDNIQQEERYFEDHTSASKLTKITPYNAYVLSDGSVFLRDGHEFKKTSSSEFSYLEWHEREKDKKREAINTIRDCLKNLDADQRFRLVGEETERVYLTNPSNF